MQLNKITKKWSVSQILSIEDVFTHRPRLEKIDCNQYSLLFVHLMSWSHYFFE